MQLHLSADVLGPIGVGVLVAVVVVIALVLGLRRNVEDAPIPGADDWISGHVGDVVTPPTRTVGRRGRGTAGQHRPVRRGCAGEGCTPVVARSRRERLGGGPAAAGRAGRGAYRVGGAGRAR